jgi:hypothetical protein
MGRMMAWAIKSRGALDLESILRAIDNTVRQHFLDIRRRMQCPNGAYVQCGCFRQRTAPFRFTHLPAPP